MSLKLSKHWIKYLDREMAGEINERKEAGRENSNIGTNNAVLSLQRIDDHEWDNKRIG